MADHRESDVLAYILGVLVLAISGIAVGIASATPHADSGSDNQNNANVTLQTPTAAGKTQNAPQESS
jgi:hypothetical protein